MLSWICNLSVSGYNDGAICCLRYLDLLQVYMQVLPVLDFVHRVKSTDLHRCVLRNLECEFAVYFCSCLR